MLDFASITLGCAKLSSFCFLYFICMLHVSTAAMAQQQTCLGTDAMASGRWFQKGSSIAFLHVHHSAGISGHDCPKAGWLWNSGQSICAE